MCAYSLPYVSKKDEAGEEAYKAKSELLKIWKGEFLNIGRGPVCEGYRTFEKVMYLYIFYWLCFVEFIPVHIA